MRPMRHSPFSLRHHLAGSPSRGSSPGRRAQARRGLWACLAAGTGMLLLAILGVGRRGSSRGSRGGVAEPPPLSKASLNGASYVGPLFSQVARDLEPFNHSGIGLRHAEQAYCQGSKASMRVQVGPQCAASLRHYLGAFGWPLYACMLAGVRAGA